MRTQDQHCLAHRILLRFKWGFFALGHGEELNILTSRCQFLLTYSQRPLNMPRMPLKQRSPDDWKMHAWEFCRQHNMPGSVADITEAMRFGYGLALTDAKDELARVTEDLVAFRNKSNAPQ